MATNDLGIVRSGLPTGKAPFAFDMSQTIAAITQQNIQEEARRMQEEKATITQNMELINKALDFETVAGLGEAIQRAHVENVKELTDRWADILSQSDGKLNMQQKLELSADKHKMESKLMTMKTDVEEFRLAQEVLNKKKYDPSLFPGIDMNQSIVNLAEYIPRVGEGKAGSIIALKPRLPFEIAEDEFEMPIKQLSDSISSQAAALDPNDKDGVIRFYESNKRKVSDFTAQLYKNSPTFRESADRIGGLEAATKHMQDMIGIERYKDQFNSSLNRTQNTTSGSNPELVDAANDFLEGIVSLDKPTWTEFGNYYFKNIKGSSPVTVDINPTADGKAYSVTIGRREDPNAKGDPGANHTKEFRIPKYMNEAERLALKQTYVGFLPSEWKKGKEGVKVSDIEASRKMKSYTPFEGLKGANMNNFSDLLTGENAQSKTARSQFAARLPEMFPGEKIEVEKSFFGTPTAIKWEGVRYSLKKTADSKKLLEKVKEKAKINTFEELGAQTGLMQDNGTDVNPPATYTEQQEAGIQAVMDRNKITREEAIQALIEAGKLPK